MSKEEKPTLAGVHHKTRKRNIAVPLDPGAFANEVIQTLGDAWKEGQSVGENLDAGVKVLETSNLDFNRYGDTLFEVFFAGGRMAAGASLAQDNGKKFQTHLFAAPAEREAIYPYVKIFQTLVRRRPFLIRSLERISVKLLKSLEFFDEEGRQKLAIATALMFSPKIKLGVLPENTLTALLNDRLVQKGTVLEFVTVFFKEYLSDNSLDDLVSVLTKAKLANRLLDLLPPQTRNIKDFSQHFMANGLEPLVQWHKKRVIDLKLNELKDGLAHRIETDTPSELVEYVKTQVEEGDLPSSDVLKILWSVLMGAVNMTGKNQQQIVQALAKQIRAHKKLLATYCTTARLEASLLVAVQVYCYEDSRLLKIFSDIVRILYDTSIVKEDTILYWYRKGSHQKGRNVFLKDIEPFIKWLEEAEEEEDDDDDDDDEDDDGAESDE